ncbi:MAG TPA: hypothetical protein VK539_36805 [Myxococcaceae bacterium]|nr:hypothetical protein [Myxococcaceae bacterium]
MIRHLTAVVLVLGLASGCGTTYRVRLDTGQGAPWDYAPATSHTAISVGADAFEDALSRLVLATPLTLRSPRQGWLIRVSYPSDTDTRWQLLMSKSFGGPCEPGQVRDDCLSLLDDVMGLSQQDKLAVALGLSLQPLKQSISRAVADTLAPQLFYTIIATGLVTWAVLAANPEPVFTKGAALLSALMLVYLGVEAFLEVVDASRELKRATDRATTAKELEDAAERFAHRVGPRVGHVLVLAATVVVSQGLIGGAASLASRLSMLPHFPQAASAGASGLGFNVASVGQVNSVAIAGTTVVISLPASAVAMVAKRLTSGTGAPAPTGQLHHPISKRIARKLEEHRTLQGHYTERDPRFVTRSANKDSHNGYQKWHSELDDEVIRWIDRNGTATPQEFEAYLRQRYSQPDLRARFPDGF